MAYPSTFSAFSRPTPSDKLSSPSHSALHNDTSSAVGQLEAVVGLNTGASASAVGTLMYFIHSPDSDGGGHIQAANKGGTGQTTFAKGDLLVATSSSVIAKLAVSSTLGEVLTSDPSQAAGVKWAGTTGTKIGVQAASVLLQGSSIETAIFATSILGSTLGSNNAAEFTIPLNAAGIQNGVTLTFKGRYAGNTVFTMAVPAPSASKASLVGFLRGTVSSAGTPTTQRASADLILRNPTFISTSFPTSIFGTFGFGTGSVVSDQTQNFLITAQYSGAADNENYLNVPFGTMIKIT